jgi:3-oxosteroid 1-dehydrogenase
VARWNDEVDLICVGSGTGGCAAAVAGADAGLKVLMLEKSGRVGGTTAWSYGILWLGNGPGVEGDDLRDSAEDTRAYLDFLGGGRNDPVITAAFVEHAPRALRYYQRAGVPLYAVPQLPDHYYPLAPGSRPRGRSYQVRPFEAASLGPWQLRLENTPYGHGRITFEEMAAWGGRAGYRNWDRAVLAEREARDVRTFGAGLAGHFFKAVMDRGVEVRTQTPVTRLVVEDGRVLGVEVEAEGQPMTIRASRGVVLATGAYESNMRLVKWWDEFQCWPPGVPKRSQGDGLIIALEHGAAFVVQHWNLNPRLGFHVQGEEVDGQPLTRGASSREVAYPHSFLVNRAGQRFADESAFGDVITKLRHFDWVTHKLINVPCYLIFDAQYLAKYGLPPLPPGAEPPDWLPRGNTPAELAERLGIQAEGLTATLERFNAFVQQGEDEDFHRGQMPWSRQAAGDASLKNPNLGSVSQPPFFGLQLLLLSGNTIGLVADTNGQVTHLRGHPIPGLYAAGELAAWQHVGVGYQAGLSLAGAMTFGWRAAQHAAGRTLEV